MADGMMTADVWIRNGAGSGFECIVRHTGLLFSQTFTTTGFVTIANEPISCSKTKSSQVEVFRGEHPPEEPW